jgi:hypothetical protein
MGRAVRMNESSQQLIKWAKEQASLLLEPLGNRWLHVQGVVERAYSIRRLFNDSEQAYLIASAYLHDIGYAPSLKRTGFHPIDGAYYLELEGQDRLASLVAYHSESQFEASIRNLLPELVFFEREHSLLANALTYCDMTTNSIGQLVSIDDRLNDIFKRYDNEHVVSIAIHKAMPFLRLNVDIVEKALDQELIVPKESIKEVDYVLFNEALRLFQPLDKNAFNYRVRKGEISKKPGETERATKYKVEDIMIVREIELERRKR